VLVFVWDALRLIVRTGQPTKPVSYNRFFPMSSAFSRIAVAVLAILVYAQAPGSKRIAIYTAQTGYTLPVVDSGTTEYAGLFETLEPMGPVSAKLDKRKWRLKFREVEAEFEVNSKRAKVAGKTFELTDKFLIANNRGLVPLRSLPTLITALTGVPIDFHQAARRLFVGANPIRYTAQVQKTDTSRLVLTFSRPVNPFIATEHGAVRLFFARDPLVSSGIDQTTFADPVFTSANFSEANGAAELAIHVTAPVIASFSDGNRTITLAPVAPPAQSPQLPSAPSVTAPAQPAVPAATPASRRPAFFILIDPAHGGSDRGAALSEALAEKDAVLTLARRLRTEFESKGITVRLLREGDVDLPSDRRAAAINSLHPGAVIFVHASTVGAGVHIATAALTAANTTPPLWDSAQSLSLSISREWADAAASEIFKRNIAVLRLRASVPPLDQVVAPAFVLEITPPPAGRAESVLAGSYVQAITSAISTATTAEHDRLAQGVH
jgi:N-acetylmuramoyl-L-alanine amidase